VEPRVLRGVSVPCDPRAGVFVSPAATTGGTGGMHGERREWAGWHQMEEGGLTGGLDPCL